MALTLSLKPGERAAINGAVIRNGDRRARITLENHARVLREADIMQPHDANSPAARIYFAIQMMILDAEAGEAWRSEFENRVGEFTGAVRGADALAACANAGAHVAAGDYYKALGDCRTLLDYEDALNVA